MCLEGTTNRATNGSHGLAHQTTSNYIKRKRSSTDLSYDDASKNISERLGTPFGCDPACIKAQLDAYYKKVHNCGDLGEAKVTPHSGEPGGGPAITNSPNDM